MFTIPVNQGLIEYSKYLLRRADFGEGAMWRKGNPEEQLTGLIGESVIRNIFNKPLISPEDGCDEGFDLTINDYTYDVKTMGRIIDPRLEFVNNLIKDQVSRKTDRYIFCSLNKTTFNLTICGWIEKPIFLAKAKLYKKNERRYRTDGTFFETKADLLELENYDLNTSESLEAFKQQLEGI